MEIEEKYLEKPWLRTYELMCVPEGLEYPEKTYTEFHLDEPAIKYPNNLALVQLDYEMTYKELKEKVDRLATALSNLGVKKGDVVASVLPTSIQSVICDMAIPEIGATHLPIDILYSVDELVDKFDRTGVKVVISLHTNVKDRDIIDKVKKAAKKTGAKSIIPTKLEDYSSKVTEHEKEEGVIWFTDLIKKYPSNPPKVDIDIKKDVAVLFFTGGTTGAPKGVMHTHYGLVAHTYSLFRSLLPESMVSLGEASLISLVTFPQGHASGHGAALPVLNMGGTTLLQANPRDTKESVRLVKKYHPLVYRGAPTHYVKLLKEEGAENLGILAMSGSMPLAPKTQKDFEEKTGSIMAEGAGMSELVEVSHVPAVPFILLPFLGRLETVGKIFHLLNRILRTPGLSTLLMIGTRLTDPKSIGLVGSRLIYFVSKNILTITPVRKRELTGSIGVPVVGVEMKIVDEDTGKKIPMEKVVKEKLRGEMCLKSPYQMLGYWPNPGSGFDEEGYVHTGDVVTVDEWGKTYVIDRMKDMANISGYKVYTREIDDLLYEYPGIEEVATIGAPDPERPGSERLKVFVLPLSEYKGKIKEEDIINYLKGKVSPYAVPKSVEFRDELPRTVTEKPFKRLLREEEIEKIKKVGILR